MKRFLSLIVGVVISVCLFTGCNNNKEGSKDDGTAQTVSNTNNGTAQTESSQYKAGTVSDGIYKNESLKLKYTPSGNIKVVNSPELKSEQEKALQSMNQKFKTSECNLELVAGEDSQDDSITMIQMISYKLDQEVSEDEFVEKTTVQSTTGKTKIGDVEFRKAMTSQSEGTYVLVLVKKVNNYFIVISVMADNEEKVNKVLSGFSKL